MNARISLSYNPIDHQRLGQVLSSYEGKSHQSIITDFEGCLKSYSGREAVALNCGTAAIHLALRALGVSGGDHVIVPTFTYVATVNPVLYLGAIPVFVDCEGETWNMDIGLMEKAIRSLVSRGRKPKAMIVVHTYGMPQDMGRVMQLSREYEIPVIEDAAEAIGTTIQGKTAGSFGDFGILSFNNNKILTTYGGGAVLCPDKKTAEKIFFWATQSREQMPYYFHAETGHNYRMSPLNAAMGLGYWPDLEKLVGKRKENFARYVRALEPAGWNFPMKESHEPNRWFTVALFPEMLGMDFRDKCLAAFSEENVEVRFLWNPLHRQPLFKDHLVFDNGVADSLFKSGICLPSGNSLNEMHFEKVIKILHNIS